ncbi:MAG: hypothetical protein R3B48_07855 [Kofleriaceae bacterium]
MTARDLPHPRRARASRAPLLLALLGALLVSGPARADIMVLPFVGPDASEVQAAVSSLLGAAGHASAPGDTTFEDAAVMIGCDASSDECAAEVRATLNVDELVFGASSKSGEIVVQRVSAEGRKQARARAEPGQDLEAALAPALRELYGEPTPDQGGDEAPSSLESAPPLGEGTPGDAAPTPSLLERADDEPRPDRRWAILSWSGAGGAALIGLVLWIKAGSLQDDIDRAPDGTPADFDALRALEERAERASSWGNAMMVVGAGLAGLGTYFWIKDRRAHRRVVAVQPVVLSGGAGVVVTFGGRL